MTRIFVDLNVASAGEALAVVRSVASAGVGVRVGPRLLARVGPLVVAALHEEAPVLADARISGSASESTAAAKSLAELGASVVTVDGRVGLDALDGSVTAAGPFGCSIAATTVLPGAPEPPSGRGKAVASVVRSIGASQVELVVGESIDIGVVAHVAAHLRVVVFGIDQVEQAADARRRGAAAIVVGAGVARAADPSLAVMPFIEAIGRADTIDGGGS